MANSFKQMAKDGTIKRPDGRMTMRIDDIHVEEGFNKRIESEQTKDDDERLFQHLMKGRPVPPLEVRVRDEGGVWIVEGHRRHRAYVRCREAGKPVDRIQIIPFTGNDVERIARIMNSNTQLPLSPYEQSLVVKELAGFNLTPDEIASLVGKSRATVDKLL
ncbi:ParB/RepB/Spo0J family partition protein, partial [Serratia marcescens]|uniref:ParB/RepB/Spo0J family partition protein n=2 Tax=Serratia TaxID=613 RepID=UPI003C79BBF3